MNTGLVIKKTIQINAPVAKVWDALVNPEVTKKYMFGCEVVTDWQVGSPLLWKGVLNGKEMVLVAGVLRRYEPQRVLHFTTANPHASYADPPEHALVVTQTLTAEDDKTVLEVTHGDFAKVREGEKRYTESVVGWEQMLATLKSLLEM